MSIQKGQMLFGDVPASAPEGPPQPQRPPPQPRPPPMPVRGLAQRMQRFRREPKVS